MPWFVKGGVEQHVTEVARALKGADVAVTVFTNTSRVSRSPYIRSLRAGGVPVRGPTLSLSTWASAGHRFVAARSPSGLSNDGPVPGRADGWGSPRAAKDSAARSRGRHEMLACLCHVAAWAPRHRSTPGCHPRPRIAPELGVVVGLGTFPGAAYGVFGTHDARRGRRAAVGRACGRAWLCVRSHVLVSALSFPIAAGRSKNTLLLHPNILPAAIFGKTGHSLEALSPSDPPPHEKEGIETLIEAFARAAEVGRSPLVVAGDGPELGRCRALAGSLGVAGQVFFRGWLPYEEVLRELSDCDVFALLSRSEGLPLTVMEAMYCGKPVVATAVGGIPELIEHGESGFLVHGAASDAAAELLGLLADNPSLRTSIGAAARTRVREAHATPEEAARWWIDRRWRLRTAQMRRLPRRAAPPPGLKNGCIRLAERVRPSPPAPTLVW